MVAYKGGATAAFFSLPWVGFDFHCSSCVLLEEFVPISLQVRYYLNIRHYVVFYDLKYVMYGYPRCIVYRLIDL